MAKPEWATKPYPGGPPVDLPGFPRPLYPPDVPESSGYEPSTKGPDVKAYKRAISRLGRWPWQTFDEGYWDDFAHGIHRAGQGSYADSGVAGFQEIQGLQPTGWLGEATYQNLRYARVPDGLPNAGEPAIDAIAQDLLTEAWQRFAMAPEAPAPGSSREARLAEARGHVGTSEYPPGSNRTEYGEWYGMDGNPWCAMFVTYCDQKGARPTDSFKRGSRYAYVPYLLSDARSGAYGLSVTNEPRPGDLVIYDWESNGEPDHIGIYEGGAGGNQFTAIEGNTSIDNNSNGGQVMRRTRSKGSGVYFVRVAE